MPSCHLLASGLKTSGREEGYLVRLVVFCLCDESLDVRDLNPVLSIFYLYQRRILKRATLEENRYIKLSTIDVIIPKNFRVLCGRRTHPRDQTFQKFVIRNHVNPDSLFTDYTLQNIALESGPRL